MSDFPIEPAESAESATSRGGKKRGAFKPPTMVADSSNLYAYLAACTPPMAERLIDIALKSYHAPYHLRDEFSQEIRASWAAKAPDLERFKPAQIAAYAYRIAYHVVLKSWRELGSPVRLPGSAFRKRADGSTYITPGTIAAPLDWTELDGWFDLGEGNNDGVPHSLDSSYGGQVQAGWDGSETGSTPTNPEAQATQEDTTAQARMDFLDEHRVSSGLHDKEYHALRLMIEGKSCAVVQEILELKRGQLQRLLEEAAVKLPDMDE